MQTQDYRPVTNCLSLTIKRDNKMMFIKNITKASCRVTIKIFLYALVLTIANIII